MQLNGQIVIIIMGLFSILFGVMETNWYGIFLVALGISWIIAGLILNLSKRRINDGGIAASAFFGFIGAIVWIVIDISRKQLTPNAAENEKSTSYLPLLSLFLLCFLFYRSHYLLDSLSTTTILPFLLAIIPFAISTYFALISKTK